MHGCTSLGEERDKVKLMVSHDMCRSEAALGAVAGPELWSRMGEAAAEIRGGEVSGDEFRGVATNVDN